MPRSGRACGPRAWPFAGAALLLSLAVLTGGAEAQIRDARYEDPTNRYPHAVLGDDVEYGTLRIFDADGTQTRITLPESRVFEDTAPRLVDVTGDGHPEVLVVESHQDLGARLVVYTQDGELTATPFIGTRFRWLAPTGIGAGDLDGDGHVELAYVDRPHLAKTLRIWRYRAGRLVELAQLENVTNHRIGERDIAGGIRTCAGRPEILVANADWTRLQAVTFDGATLSRRTLGTDTRRAAFAAAMLCADGS